MNKGYFKTIYKVVEIVPEGNAATYGQIAEAIWKSQIPNPKSQKRITPRIVGWALHANKDSKIPCHRVVDRNGRLGGDGHEEQRRRLLAERVKFIDEMHVDLGSCLWHPR